MEQRHILHINRTPKNPSVAICCVYVEAWRKKSMRSVGKLAHESNFFIRKCLVESVYGISCCLWRVCASNGSGGRSKKNKCQPVKFDHKPKSVGPLGFMFAFLAIKWRALLHFFTYDIVWTFLISFWLLFGSVRIDILFFFVAYFEIPASAQWRNIWYIFFWSQFFLLLLQIIYSNFFRLLRSLLRTYSYFVWYCMSAAIQPIAAVHFPWISIRHRIYGGVCFGRFFFSYNSLKTSTWASSHVDKLYANPIGIFKQTILIQ